MHNVLETVIHPDKAVFNPTQQLIILGFVLNSVNMTITLTQEKALALQTACTLLPNTASPTMREVARVLGKMVSSFPGVMYGLYTIATLNTIKLTHCETTDGILTGACLYRRMLNRSLSGG